jgi:RND superfamily putative drug exporter
VVLDATVVRGILAPAAMVMLGRRNWWPSDPTKERHDAREGTHRS